MKSLNEQSENTIQTDYLIETIQALSMARSLEEIQHIVKHAARHLVGAQGATFILREKNQCYYIDEDTISPLWKGQKFDMESCVSGWAMIHKQTSVIPDIYLDPRVPKNLYRDTFIKSLVMVPIRTHDPIGAIGVYWRTSYHPSSQEIKLLEALANSTSIAIENIKIYSTLEQLVSERTAQLQTLNKELEAFTYSISHDLRSPLTVISALSQMIQHSPSNCLAPQAIDFFKRIDSNIKKMNERIDDCLALSKISQFTIKRQTIELSHLTEEILLEYLNDNPERVIHYSIAPAMTLQGDPKLIRILLENLIGNALKYSAKTTITQISIKNFKKNNIEGIYIKDNGVGFVMPNEPEELFYPFKRYHSNDEFPGTGIGLAIVKRIIQLHDGVIWANSAPGKGATFYFYVN